MNGEVIVFDCGIYLATLLPNEPFVDEATALLNYAERTGPALAAPTLLRYEMAATLRKNVFRRRLWLEDGQILIKQVCIFTV